MNRNPKRLLLWACNPIDHIVQRLNGKGFLPPLHLRWQVGPLRGFESSGTEFRIYLRQFAGLVPDSQLLDLGCGCGQIALQVTDVIEKSGSYVGCDVDKRAICWCNARIAARHPQFSFFHMNVQNGQYNPKGEASAAQYRFPLGDDSFSIILLKSIFTHMLRDGVANYLHEVSRLLKPAGMCLATFFLLNEAQKRLERENRNLIKFHRRNDGVYVANPNVAEAIVGYEEAEVLDLIRQAGMRLARPVEYGGWTGDRSALSHQDILVLEPDTNP